jgi:ABC-type phosphate/phosphonate transport system permease subunit
LQFLDLACHHEDRPFADVGDAVSHVLRVVRRPQEHVGTQMFAIAIVVASIDYLSSVMREKVI